MTETEARIFRAAHQAAVTRYSRMSKTALHREWLALLADQGVESLYGGPSSKDELLSAVLDLRGYTIAKLNEAGHVLHHQVPWPDCGHCAPVFVPSGTGWPVP